MASRQRHQSPRPATNRSIRRPARYRRHPLETTTRPAHRPFHRSIRQSEVQRTTSSTHRTESLPPLQPAPIPNTRPAAEGARRTRPLTPSSCCARALARSPAVGEPGRRNRFHNVVWTGSHREPERKVGGWGVCSHCLPGSRQESLSRWSGFSRTWWTVHSTASSSRSSG
jgi:hypothetical protein